MQRQIDLEHGKEGAFGLLAARMTSKRTFVDDRGDADGIPLDGIVIKDEPAMEVSPPAAAKGDGIRISRANFCLKDLISSKSFLVVFMHITRLYPLVGMQSNSNAPRIQYLCV